MPGPRGNNVLESVEFEVGKELSNNVVDEIELESVNASMVIILKKCN